jgi:siroheme synthase (precorrin-2 oxidase/ferrochelatase)
MANTSLCPFAVKPDETSLDYLIKSWDGVYLGLKVATNIFILAQRVKKKVKALFGQIIIHLARLLGETVAGREPDHQEDPEQNRSHWWKEIKNFVTQIQSEELSEAQLRRILEDAFEPQEVDAVMEALRQAAEMMEDSTPTLFQ